MAVQELINKNVDQFQALFDLYANRLNGIKDSPYFRIKQDAVRHLVRKGFPGRKNEDWKYTNLTQLLKTRFQHPARQVSGDQLSQPLPNSVRISFENGLLVKEQSDLDKFDASEVEVMTVEDALKNATVKDKVLLELENMEQVGVSAFGLLSLAFAQGLVIQVKKNTRLSNPIHITYASSGSEKNTLTSQLCLVMVESGSKAEIFQSIIGKKDQSYLQTIYNRFVIAENANLSVYKWQEEGDQGNLIYTTEINQAHGSTYTDLSLDLGGKLVRNNLYATHLGQNITTNLYGSFVLSGQKQHLDNQTFVDHAQPHCQSNELYKGIIDHYSKAVFNGKIIVRPDAQKINAFQQNAGLLLSDHASIDSKPQLEIFADDVRCSHGATIGQLDEQALYYLMTRGLERKQATKMLQSAFIQEVFAELEEDNIARYLQDKLSTYL